MFYSHNLLARKGPLGTVWCAAHLQNKLKKSNYITINIPSTVEQIMNPQVPIALRMSGHLLLGVVRIYSKKVEYLQHDYNVLSIDISKAYAYTDINLPQDANQAKFESITLPDNFALDLMDVDEYNPNASPDSHLRPNEDISFMDHTPISISKRRDQRTPAGYIKISVGEEPSQSPIIPRDNLPPVSMQFEENIHPQTPPPPINGVEDPDPNHQFGSIDIFPDEENVTPFEIHREAENDSGLPDMVEPDPELVKQFSIEKVNNSLNLDEILTPGGPMSPPKQTPQPEFAHSEPEPEPETTRDNSGPHASFGLAPSPPPVELAIVAEQPRVKRRKIKYDEATVLSNEFMKKSIDDASNLKRKRKGVSTFLGVWKLNNTYKKEKVLFDPLIIGLGDNLSQMYEDGYVSSKPDLTVETEQPNSDDMEIEIARNIVDPSDYSVGLGPTNSPDKRSPFSCPQPNDENTPGVDTDVGVGSYQMETTVGTRAGSTPDPTSSIGSFVSDVETPFPDFQSQQGFENSGGLSDIPEVDDAGDLFFMEDDEGTPGLRGTPDSDYSSGKQRPPLETGSLLPRTKALAQYIKEKSTATPSSSENAGSVTMNSILQGKSRKICSRMFFETLVLKSCDLIDVKQDEPYGDITFKVTPKLSKFHFSD